MPSESAKVSLLVEAIDQASAVFQTVNQSIDKAGGKVEELGKKSKNSKNEISGLGQASEKAGELLKEWGTKLTGLFSVAAIEEFTRHALNTIATVGKMSATFGVAVEEMSRLSTAMHDMGIDSGTAEAGMRRFSQQITEAFQNPSSRAADVFRALNVEIKNADGTMRGLDEVLKDVATAFSGFANGQQKVTAAVEFFGRGAGVEFLRFLNKGREGIEEMGKVSDEFGATVSTKAVEALRETKQVWNEFKTVLEGFFIQFAEQLIPAFKSMADVMLELSKNTQGLHVLFAGVGEVIKGLVAVVVALVTGLQMVGTVIGYVGAAAVSVAKGQFHQAGQIMEAMEKDLDGQGKKMLDTWAKLFDLQSKAAEPAEAKKAFPVIEQAQAAQNAIKDIERTRAVAERTYQENLLETERMLRDHEISQSEAEVRRIKAAQALEQELAKVVRQYDALAKAETNPERKRELQERGSQTVLEKRRVQLEATAPEPGNLKNGLANFADSLEGIRDKTRLVATTINATLKPALQGISQGIYGIITGTKTWGQVALSVGASILQNLIDIGVQMIAQSILRSILGKKSVGESVSEAETTTGAWTLPAILTSIGSSGTAAIIGIALVLAAIGLFAAGVFESGGYTGPGPSNQAAGIVHANEYVIPSPVVNALGADHFDEYLKGRVPASTVVGSRSFSPIGGAASTQGRSNSDVHIGFINDRQDERQFLAREGFKIVMDKMARRSNKLNA